MTGRNKPAMKAAVDAAMTIATEVATGVQDPADLDATATAAVWEIATQVVGPGDPAWEPQLHIARGVLAAGGIPGVELAEWAAVYAQPDGPREPSWIETALGLELELDVDAAEAIVDTSLTPPAV